MAESNSSPPLARRLFADRGGVSALEFALVGPVLLMFVIGLIYVAAAVFAYASMQYAVEESARCSSVKTTVCTSSTTIRSYAASHYFGPGTPVFTTSTPACGNQVSASLTYAWNIPFFNSVPLALTAAACFP